MTSVKWLALFAVLITHCTFGGSGTFDLLTSKYLWRRLTFKHDANTSKQQEIFPCYLYAKSHQITLKYRSFYGVHRTKSIMLKIFYR